MEGRPNLLKGTTDWNKKPEAGYLDMMGKEKNINHFSAAGQGKETGKGQPFSIPKTASGTENNFKRENSSGGLMKGKKEKQGGEKSKSPETIRPMTPLSGLSLGKSDLLRTSLTQQIPTLTLRSHYRDSKLFQVIQSGIMEVGMYR